MTCSVAAQRTTRVAPAAGGIAQFRGEAAAARIWSVLSFGEVPVVGQLVAQRQGALIPARRLVAVEEPDRRFQHAGGDERGLSREDGRLPDSPRSRPTQGRDRQHEVQRDCPESQHYCEDPSHQH